MHLEPQQPEPIDREPEQNCDYFNRQCDSLRCPYGLLKLYDARSGCEQCQCEDPCRDYECSSDSKCSVDITSQEGPTVFVAVCRKQDKPGRCPRLEDTANCEAECDNDADCRGDHKCCNAGCSRVCALPIDERERATTESTYYHPDAQAPTLEQRPDQDLRPVAREGAVATLRCFATGFPPPSITWKRGGIEVINL